MATIATILIRVISLLGKQNKLTREVGGGKRTLDDFFPAKKARDARWEEVMVLIPAKLPVPVKNYERSQIL